MGFLNRIFQIQSNENDANQEMKRKINEEVLRQVKWKFNLAWSASAASVIMILFGVGLLYFNQVQEGCVTTGTGILSSFVTVQLAKDAQEDLRKLM
jgi:hypothetical protein